MRSIVMKILADETMDSVFYVGKCIALLAAAYIAARHVILPIFGLQ
jgi:hypothetical protein